MDSLLQKSWAYAVGTLPDWIWPACASPVVRATGSNAASADCSLRKQLWIYLLGIKCPSQLGNWTFLSLKDHISSKTHCASRPYCSSSYGCQESCSTYPQINTKTLNLMLHRSVSVSVWQQLHSWINISFYNTFPGYKWSYWKNQATAAALCCHPVPACVLSIHTCSGDYQRVCSHIPHVSALISYFLKTQLFLHGKIELKTCSAFASWQVTDPLWALLLVGLAGSCLQRISDTGDSSEWRCPLCSYCWLLCAENLCTQAGRLRMSTGL